MPGRYENFPRVIHGVARFAYQPSRRKLQQTILQTLHRLNREACGLKEIAPLSSSKYEASFELGVAEGITFNYLNRRELNRIQKAIVEKALPVLDFLCVVRYHFVDRGKRVALKFDYHMLRFLFRGKNAELRIFHERGPRHVSPEELLTFVAKRINEELLRNRLNPLTRVNLRAI